MSPDSTESTGSTAADPDTRDSTSPVDVSPPRGQGKGSGSDDGQSSVAAPVTRSHQIETICIVGLGYVGLPLACEFDRQGYDVVGYDVDPEKVATLESGVDPTGDVGDEVLVDGTATFTTEPAVVGDADLVILAVPTPIDDQNTPNLTYVEAAGETIGIHLQPGATVVLESTVYPGATREILIPALERTSGLTAGEDFGVGYSPERLVPGDPDHGLRDVVKIVSGLTAETRDELARVYKSIVDAGVHRAPTIETAETAKCVENVQRDLNIALVNELAIACSHLGIDSRAVLEAAGTKWNFHHYRPGLVGGHCIPVDPFYLIYESEQNGFSPELIQKGREVNEYVPKHVAELTIKALNSCRKVLSESRVLVCGLTYKPNVEDLRTSLIGDVIDGLTEYDIDVVGYDPHADAEAAAAKFGIQIQQERSCSGFDGLVIGTAHDEFSTVNFDAAADQMNDDPVLVDVDGTFENQATAAGFTYRRL